MVLALAFTESSLDYNAKHKNDIAVGICGIVPKFHKELLDSYNVPINSLKACEVVYNYYLEINKGNKIKSLISYKGIESKDNIYLVYKVLEIEKGLK